jgi:hypothetical protein
MARGDERSRTLAATAGEALHRLVRERLARKGGGHLVEGSLERIDLALPLVLRGADAGRESLIRRLIEQIDLVLDEAIEHAARFRPGHAPCRRCDAVPCPHSAAPSHRHVFVGYSPTGIPRWQDFAQHCLERRHPDVDRLYDDPPAFIAIVRTRDELTAGLLDTIRDAPGPELAGQVVAGFFPVPMREGEGRGVIAVTFQVGASRGARTRTRWGINILGSTPQGEPLELLWERQDEIPWTGAVRWAQAALATLAREKGRSGPALDRRIDGILAGLARRLAHERRSRSRRTLHAHRRHTTGERPTRSAIDDTRVAKPADVMVDDRTGTLVVPGARGRMHFYTPGGRLVSSVRYSREAIERKRKLGLWRASRPEESAPLLAKVRS